VYHAVNIRVLLEHLVQLLLIRDIAIVELRLLAADQLYAVYDFRCRVVAVIDNDHLVVGLEEGERSE